MDLSDVAAGGIFSAADARRIGVDVNLLRRLLRAREVERLIPGWYAVGTPADARARHLLCARAWLRRLEGKVSVSHHSALIFHGLPTMARDLDTVHLCRTGDRHTRRGRGVVFHVPVPGCRQEAVTSAVAAVQSGMLNHPLDLLVAGDAALRAGVATREQFDEALELFCHHENVGAVRALLPQLDGRHESPGETRLAHVMHGLGLKFTPQVWIRGLRDCRVDFLLDEAPVIVEFDGAVKYADGDRSGLFAEKRRGRLAGAGL